MGSGEARLVLHARIELAGGLPEHAERVRSPAWSQTQAATMPPERVTRSISGRPATGSAMKWTTSCASAASKLASSKGSRSADACRTSTPGWRSLPRRRRVLTGRPPTPPRRRAAGRARRSGRPARSRRRAHAAPPALRRTRELGRQLHRVTAHEPVVGVRGDLERHLSEFRGIASSHLSTSRRTGAPAGVCLPEFGVYQVLKERSRRFDRRAGVGKGFLRAS